MCILIPLLVGLISALLGYLLGKLLSKNDGNSSRVSDLEAELSACRSNALKLEAELNGLKSNSNASISNSLAGSSQLESDLSLSRTKINQLEDELRSCKSDYDALKAISNQSSNDDDAIKNYREQIEKLETDLRLCKSKSSVLENDLETCKMDKSRLEADLKDASSNNLGNLAAGFAAGTSAAIAFDASAAKAVFGKTIKQDDLKLVEGIGPKIEQLFHDHDVKTWKALSECSIEKCNEVLKSGGKRFEMHKPNTWPKQALLAYEGKWQELLDWQDELDGGR